MAELKLINHTINIAGELTFDTAPDLRKQGDKLLQEHDALSVDFSAVTKVDSSALSLLLAWLRTAKQASNTVTFVNLPAQLNEMAALTHIDKIIR